MLDSLDALQSRIERGALEALAAEERSDEPLEADEPPMQGIKADSESITLRGCKLDVV